MSTTVTIEKQPNTPANDEGQPPKAGYSNPPPPNGGYPDPLSLPPEYSQTAPPQQEIQG